MERAAAHAATAANIHWGLFAHARQRQLGHVLFILAHRGQISYTSAWFLHRFNHLRVAIDRDRISGNRPAARRTLRNSRRRVARIIASVNRAIAADPNPAPTIYPC